MGQRQSGFDPVSEQELNPERLARMHRREQELAERKLQKEAAREIRARSSKLKGYRTRERRQQKKTGGYGTPMSALDDDQDSPYSSDSDHEALHNAIEDQYERDLDHVERRLNRLEMQPRMPYHGLDLTRMNSLDPYVLRHQYAHHSHHKPLGFTPLDGAELFFHGMQERHYTEPPSYYDALHAFHRAHPFVRSMDTMHKCMSGASPHLDTNTFSDDSVFSILSGAGERGEALCTAVKSHQFAPLVSPQLHYRTMCDLRKGYQNLHYLYRKKYKPTRERLQQLPTPVHMRELQADTGRIVYELGQSYGMHFTPRQLAAYGHREPPYDKPDRSSLLFVNVPHTATKKHARAQKLRLLPIAYTPEPVEEKPTETVTIDTEPVEVTSEDNPIEPEGLEEPGPQVITMQELGETAGKVAVGNPVCIPCIEDIRDDASSASTTPESTDDESDLIDL